MALSNWNIQEDNKTFVNLKLKSTVWPTEERPVFVVLGDDFKETKETYSKAKGKLLKIKGTFTPAKWRMGDIYGFKAFLEDGDEIYVIESTITNASKDLLNALLVNIGKVLDIWLYLNKNGYPTSSVKLSGNFEDGNWAQTAFEYNQIYIKKLYEKIEELNAEKEGEEIQNEDIPF